MARIRQIKPEFFDDPDIGALSPLARLMFIGLWTQADKAGRLVEDHRRLKIRLCSFDKANAGSLVNELVDAGFVVRYEVGDRKYLQVRSFHKHQHPHVKEVDSTLPPCPAPNESGQAPGQHGASTGPAPGKHPASTPCSGSGVQVLVDGVLNTRTGAAPRPVEIAVENSDGEDPPEPPNAPPSPSSGKSSKPRGGKVAGFTPVGDVAPTVIAKLTRCILEEGGDWESEADLVEEIKTRCARLHLVYDSGHVQAALNSEQWKARQRRSA